MSRAKVFNLETVLQVQKCISLIKISTQFQSGCRFAINFTWRCTLFLIFRFERFNFEKRWRRNLRELFSKILTRDKPLWIALDGTYWRHIIDNCYLIWDAIWTWIRYHAEGTKLLRWKYTHLTKYYSRLVCW